MKGVPEKESIIGVRDRHKNTPSRSQSCITRQDSWCQTVITGDRFSKPRDAQTDREGRILLSTPHTNDTSL